MLWMKQMVQDYGHCFVTILDAICITKNPALHSKTNLFEIRFFDIERYCLLKLTCSDSKGTAIRKGDKFRFLSSSNFSQESKELEIGEMLQSVCMETASPLSLHLSEATTLKKDKPL